MLDPTSGNFPGGTQHDVCRLRAEPLLGADRPRDGDHGHGLPGAGREVRLQRRPGRAPRPWTSWGFFVSDSWRVKPNLTLNGGLRYEVQLPFRTDAGQLRAPAGLADGLRRHGRRVGQRRAGQPVQAGHDDRHRAGARSRTRRARPATTRTTTTSRRASARRGGRTSESGFLSKILSADPVFRGGYSLSFSRQGFASFTNYGSNPGGTRAATRTTTTGCNGACTIGSDGCPVLLRRPRGSSRRRPSRSRRCTR